jgi:copper resistance protein B
MDHSQMDHAAMGHPMPAPAVNGPRPPAASSGPPHAADALWGAETMAAARTQMAVEMGGDMTTGVFHIDRLEARLGGEDGYLWDVEAAVGGPLDGLVIKSAGEGAFGGKLEALDLQALWGTAISPWLDLQAGVRLDVEPDTRAYAALGVEGLLPYNVHLDATAFLSDQGDLTGEIEATHDMRLTQRLILQPRAAAELAAQDGAGLASIEGGLYLRYEITRQFAPYIGVEHGQSVGRTRRLARLAGDDPSVTALVLGVRAWF